VFTGGNYLFSMIGKSGEAEKERKRHDLAIEQLQQAEFEYQHKRQLRLDYLNKQLRAEEHSALVLQVHRQNRLVRKVANRLVCRPGVVCAPRGVRGHNCFLPTGLPSRVDRVLCGLLRRDAAGVLEILNLVGTPPRWMISWHLCTIVPEDTGADWLQSRSLRSPQRSRRLMLARG